MEIDSNQTLTIEQIRQNAFAQAYANVSALAVQSQHEVFFSQYSYFKQERSYLLTA